MEKWEFLKNIQKIYAIDFTVEEDEASIVNPDNGKCIKIYSEKYYSKDGKEAFSEYIVCFATQHRHFDELDEVEEYIHEILKDEVLPIEFYVADKRGFGGEIEKAELETLTFALLAQQWGYSTEYLSARDYEICSWSGKYDSGRKKVADTDPNRLIWEK